MLEKVRVPRLGPGRPRVRPDRVRADKAYASRRNRAYLRRPGPQPPEARAARWPAAALRSGRLPPAPCGRVWNQPSQETPCCRHAI
ncbi:hypothetical protein [Streptomyces olivaceus]